MLSILSSLVQVCAAALFTSTLNRSWNLLAVEMMISVRDLSQEAQHWQPILFNC